MTLPFNPSACIPNERYDIAIIGAGFSGTMLAIHLASAADPPKVALIERKNTFGPGLAYGAASPEHLLNVPAGKMGAFPHQQDHFLHWARARPGAEKIEPGEFLPRSLYGTYLKDLLQEATHTESGPSLLHGEAVDIEPDGDGHLIHFSDGGKLATDQVILAWGNLPPGNPGNTSGHENRFIRNPWSLEADAALESPGDILIIGSGLTSLDLLASAKKIGRQGRIHVLSRHGLFPHVHRAASARERFLDPDNLPREILKLFRLVRSEIKDAESTGSDWRAVIDSIRPFTQSLWKGLPEKERRRFLRHLRTLWETARHRAAPVMNAIKEEMESSGQLIRQRGRLERLVSHADSMEVVFRPRYTRESKSIHVSAVINATGPESDPSRSGSTLLKNLLQRGLIRPDPLGLGVEVPRQPSQEEDPLHTVGSLRRGSLWESTAVPELRVQAAQLARQLIASRAEMLAGVSGGHRGEVWLFDI